jgi:Periplasmic protein involved in polysaccharide export
MVMRLYIFPIEEFEKNYVLLISSSVSRPGKYQLTKGMKISDLINEADGILYSAFKEVGHIKRYGEDLTHNLISFNLTSVLQGKSDDHELKYMDEVFIYNNNEIKNVFSDIDIYGSVKNPGTFSLSNNQTLSDLILKSGGFIKGVTKVKISVARKRENSNFPNLYYFPSDGTKLFVEMDDLNDPENDINKFKLKSYDIVNIYSDPNYKVSDKVVINGEVKYPGVYPIISKNEKVSDVLSRAGGFLETAYPFSFYFYSRW